MVGLGFLAQISMGFSGNCSTGNHMTFSSSEIEMAIAKSQTENVYKYLARAKTFTASFEKIQSNLCLFTNTV